MDSHALKKVALGVASYVPGMLALRKRVVNPSGMASARYSYSVWLRHLVRTRSLGISVEPKIVAELGPGNSLGVGLAALLSGADKYWALDVDAYEDLETNLHLFDKMLELFKSRAPVPGDEEFPELRPRLQSYEFPGTVLTEKLLKEALNPERVHQLRQTLRDLIDGKSHPAGGMTHEIRYIVPGLRNEDIPRGRADMVVSQAVMEHVEDVSGAYGATFEWLASGGVASHRIDFRSHGSARVWNGHWAYSDSTWRLMKGRKPFMINRMTFSQHLSLLHDAGFEILLSEGDSVSVTNGITRAQLARKFRHITDEDLVTSGAYIVARKP